MQICSLTMQDTKRYEAESDSTEKNWPRISHKIKNQISTGISLSIVRKDGKQMWLLEKMRKLGIES